MSSLATARGSAVRERISGTMIAPSILSADYGRLADQVQEVLDAGAEVVHFDVMDGHFVPPITFGPVVVAALSELVHAAGAIVDVHLMIERPERHVESFAAAGADTITIHAEATPNLHYALDAIRGADCLAGLALNPGTPAEQVQPLADVIDLALCMTVNPGWGGQKFIHSSWVKLRRLRELLGNRCAIQVDGGIDAVTGPECLALGANLLVAGSAIFNHSSPGQAYRELAAAARAR
jgi:ribulose-phosphate 3-epimerase